MKVWILTIFALWICQASPMTLRKRQIEGSLRLVGGRDNTQGRLEIYHRGQWGTVCDDNFDSDAARVACRDLGQSGGQKTQAWQFGQSSGPVWISDVNCRGTEGRLTQCQFTGWGNTQCGSHENVGVRCGFGSGSRFNAAGGSGSINSGSRYNSGTGSRYNSAGNRYHSSSSSSSNHRYTYSNTNRGGSVSRPISSGISQPEREGGLRLLEGRTPSQGRVEIFHNGKWGTVCKDGFDDLDATVVCRQLGLDGGIAKPPSWFGAGFGEIWMSRAGCNGRENRLTDCPYKGWGAKECHHTEDVGVECFSSARANY